MKIQRAGSPKGHIRLGRHTLLAARWCSVSFSTFSDDAICCVVLGLRRMPVLMCVWPQSCTVHFRSGDVLGYIRRQESHTKPMRPNVSIGNSESDDSLKNPRSDPVHCSSAYQIRLTSQILTFTKTHTHRRFPHFTAMEVGATDDGLSPWTTLVRVK